MFQVLMILQVNVQGNEFFFSKNGNWDDASLNLAMEAIEDASELQITS
jgi:hypothetical protein